jgi:hypothetical protein
LQSIADPLFGNLMFRTFFVAGWVLLLAAIALLVLV